MTLNNLDSLTDIVEFNSLVSVGGKLEITANPSLVNISGINSINSIYSLNVKNNYYLAEITGLTALTSIDTSLTISSNHSLLECYPNRIYTQLVGFTGTYNQYSNLTDGDYDCVADTDDAFPSDDTESVDTDGDGTGNNADTDDDGDGVDDEDDCDSLDSSVGLEITYYMDNDEDGYGDSEAHADSMTVCPGDEEPEYVGNNDDCDDEEPSFNPDAAEVCDGEDNDCNGLVDDSCS